MAKQSSANTVNEYIQSLPTDRAEAIKKLQKVIKKNLPKGYQECMSYGMIGYVVPHKIYPKGYHCDSKLPLPLINLASQKNCISLYHMGIYGMPALNEWFIAEYTKLSITKIDMGKGCVRFKKLETIPFLLIGELAAKITVAEYVAFVDATYVKK